MTRDCPRDRCRCKTSSRSCGRTTRRTRRRCGAARGVSSPLRGTGEMWEICGDTGRFGEIWGDSDMHGTFSKLSPEPRGTFLELSRYRVTFKPMVYLRAAPATNPATRTSAFLFCTTFSFFRRPPRSAAIPLLVFIFHDIFLLFRRPPRARPSSRLVLRAPSSRLTPPSPHTRGCGRARAILSACSVSFSYCRCFVSVFRCARAGPSESRISFFYTLCFCL